MGIFDKDTLKQISALEKRVDRLAELNKLTNNQIASLKTQLIESEKRSPEFEKESRQASRKTSEFKNKANETLNEIIEIKSTVLIQKKSVETLTDELKNFFTNIKEEYDIAIEHNSEIEKVKDEINIKIDFINNKIAEIESVFQNHPDLETELQNLEEFLEKSEDVSNKSAQLLKGITSKKNEIDKLHNEIIGFEEIDEESGEKTHISGIKDELEEAYDGYSDQLDDIKTKIEALDKTSKSRFDIFFEKSEDTSSKLWLEWTDKFVELNTKIQSLLPNALTAGLSYAFSEKKKDEVKAYENHKKQFGYGIGGMITVSLIPFIISIIFIIDNVNLETVINRVPRVVLAILPLYVPVLWLSISSSKKMNLSKRLIEEYSHKEVLSKTYEGLSSQIENLNNEGISNELRISLIQNFLHMYSENPGKLISNYNTSDHPIMEVLENRNRLENSIDKLNKIPGMEKLATYIDKKSKEKLEKAADKLDVAIDRIIDENILPKK